MGASRGDDVTTLGDLAVRVRVLALDDSLGRAAEAVRASTVGAAPVVEDGRLVGLVTASILAAALASAPPPAADTPVASLPIESAVALPESLAPRDALRFFDGNGLERAAVLDAHGGLVGLVGQAELAAALCGRVKPALIGGMATPFGVYLTGGGARGGVGDLALASTGVFMAVLFLGAQLLADWLFSPPVLQWLANLGARETPLADFYAAQAYWVVLGIFAVLFRLSWVTGYHAAEHQVVHALEAGDDLKPEVVAAKPRVHPRCGTNLVTASLIMSAFWAYRGDATWETLGPVPGLLVTVLLWRRLGGMLQQYVTTSPAAPYQIESGIAAGRQLLRRYQQGAGRGGFARRVWNMGLLQVLAGWAVVMAVLWGLTLLRVPLPPSISFTG
jgi:CBS domain-containing protein